MFCWVSTVFCTCLFYGQILSLHALLCTLELNISHCSSIDRSGCRMLNRFPKSSRNSSAVVAFFNFSTAFARFASPLTPLTILFNLIRISPNKRKWSDPTSALRHTLTSVSDVRSEQLGISEHSRRKALIRLVDLLMTQLALRESWAIQGLISTEPACHVVQTFNTGFRLNQPRGGMG